jgi:hypothetical protein
MRGNRHGLFLGATLPGGTGRNHEKAVRITALLVKVQVREPLIARLVVW